MPGDPPKSHVEEFRAHLSRRRRCGRIAYGFFIEISGEGAEVFLAGGASVRPGDGSRGCEACIPVIGFRPTALGNDAMAYS